MSSTTWNGSSSTDWATGANWSTGSPPTTSAHVVIPDTSSINNCALDTTRTIGSLTIEANGTLVGGGNKLIIQSEGDASGGTEGFAVNNDGIISGNLDLEVNTPATTTCDFNGTSGNFKNVKINDVNVDATFHTDTTFDGTLIVAGGTLKPQGGSTIDVHGDVTISSGATFGVSTGTGTHRFGSLTVNGTHVATSGETIIDNERSNGRAVDIVGTFTHNTGTLSIQTAADTDLRWPSSSQAYNLRINNASCIARPTGDNKPVIANNLSIDAGTFNTLEGGQNHGLTVLGDTTGAGTLALNNSTYTGGGTGDNLSMTGTVTIGTSGVITNVDQLGESGGTITCTGSPTLGCQRWRQPTANWTPATSTLKIESNNRQFQTNGYGTPYNLEIDNSGNTNELSDFVVVSNNLTITAGTFDTSTSNRALTVTGAIDVASGGALTCNSSAVQCNGLRTTGGTVNLPDASGSFTVKGTEFSGYGIYDRVGSGNIVHNGGTVTWDIGGMSTMYALSTFNNITTATSGTTLRWFSALTLAGDLTVAANTNVNEHASAGGAFTVSGDVDVSGTLGNSDAYSAYSFGSLTINSGGTYTATSETTTITNKNSSNYMFFDAGTFTHNNGTVHFKADTSSGTWYAVKGHSTEETTEFYNFTTERVGSSVGNYRVCVGGSNQFLTVRNNLTVGANCKIFSGNGSSILRQSGLATLNGELDLDNFTDIEMGAVTINSGGTLEFDNGSITLKAESFRNVGGTINA